MLFSLSLPLKARKKIRKYLWNTKWPQPAPDSKGYWQSRICLCFEKSQLLGIFGQLPVAESVKRHIYTPRPVIWAYSQVSTTILSKETAWKSSCFEKPLFLDIFAKFGHFRWSNLANLVKRHIYTPRPNRQGSFLEILAEAPAPYS